MDDKKNIQDQIDEKLPLLKTKKGIGIILIGLIGICCIGVLLLAGLGSLMGPDKLTPATPASTSNITESKDDEKYLTTDILLAKDCKLDKHTFKEPDNIDVSFKVKLVKHGFKDLSFSLVQRDWYDEYIKYGKKTNIGGIDGYLLTGYDPIFKFECGFIFVFEKNGKTYMVNDVGEIIKWSSYIEKDIAILLKEWDSKNLK